MRGTNDSMPLATPKTLTLKHQVQSLASCSQGRPPPPEVTPALLKRRWQAPSLANTSSASASTEAADETSVTTPRTCPAIGQLVDRCLEHRLLDVGDDDPRALLEQRLDDAAADAGRSPGDHGHLAVQVVQRCCPQSPTSSAPATISLGSTVLSKGLRTGRTPPWAVRRC